MAIGSLNFGCADDDGDSNGGSVSVEEPEDFSNEANERLVTAACEGIFECPEKQDPNLLSFFSGFSDQQSCEAYLNDNEGVNAGDMQELVAAAEDGRVTYSPDAAEDCLEEFEEATQECTAVGKATFSGGACDEVFEGDKEEDDACLISEECAEGECDRQSDPDTCYGTCEPGGTAGEGESCSPGDCDPNENLTCSSTDGDGECVAPQSVGEDEPCRELSQCEGDLVCLDSVCTEPETPKEDGESCGYGEGLVVCAGGLTCQDLASNSETGAVEGECGSPLQEGDSCLASFECERGLYCDGADFEAGEEGECAPTKEVDESCESSEECGVFTECVDSTCRPSGEDSEDEQCELPDDE